MSPSPSSRLAVGVPGLADRQLSPEQAMFNSLLMDIHARRDSLAGWERVVPAFQHAFAGELVPLQTAGRQLERELILLLDGFHDHAELSATQRRLVSSLLLTRLKEHPELAADDALQAVFNRHSASDYEEETAEDVAMVKAELEAMLGESLGRDEDFASREELLRHARQRLARLQAQDSARKEARAERRSARAKAKKPEAAARREALQAELNQSLKDIYRKLASALHPDRESDAEMKLRKTAMLQAVNQAYDKQDLLHLLEVQLELQQLDSNSLNDLGDDRLRHYNKLLREQLDELDQELSQAELQFAHGYGIRSHQALTPDTALALLRAQIVRQQFSNEATQKELRRCGDIRSFREWLKEVKRELKDRD